MCLHKELPMKSERLRDTNAFNITELLPHRWNSRRHLTGKTGHPQRAYFDVCLLLRIVSGD